MIEKIMTAIISAMVILFMFCMVSIAAAVVKIADNGLDCAYDEERFEAIEKDNRVQQRQLNDLMYPGVYNGVH